MDESLNETLQEESSRNRALALYEGTRGDDLVSEDVDERILKLLGLDDVFDIDYGTYMTLLREKMVEARMTDKKLSTEESMLIDEEYRRVKGKVGRFKLKKKKISAENLGVTGPIQVSKQQYYLTSKAIVPETSGTGENNGDLLKNVITINETVSKILESLNSQNKLIKKSDENERKRYEQDQRGRREEGLEKGLSKISSLASKMLAPVQGILDKILNFILYTLLGRAFVKFIDWFNDPKNKEKVEVLKRFLKDWWPTLLGALVLFTTPFGKFVRGFVGTVAKLTLQLARFAIPKLLSFVKSNPKTALALAAGTAAVGAGIYMQSQREQRDKELQKADPNYGKTPSPQKSILDFGSMGGLGFRGGGMIPVAKAFTGGGEQLQPYVGDGFITDNTGVTVKGAGADTQATVLQPGEIVFSKPAVNYWGADNLLAMNKIGGGTNVPKFVNNIQMAVGGGMIGKGFKSPSIQMATPNIRMPLSIMGGSRQRMRNNQSKSNININNPRPLMNSFASKRYSGGGFNTPNYSSMSGGNSNFVMNQSSPTISRPNFVMNQNNPIVQRNNLSSFTQNVFSSSNTPSNVSYSSVNISPQITSSQKRLTSPGPPVPNSAGAAFIKLPPIIEKETRKAASAGGTKLPQFMSSNTENTLKNLDLYGIKLGQVA